MFFLKQTPTSSIGNKWAFVIDLIHSNIAIFADFVPNEEVKKEEFCDDYYNNLIPGGTNYTERFNMNRTRTVSSVPNFQFQSRIYKSECELMEGVHDHHRERYSLCADRNGPTNGRNRLPFNSKIRNEPNSNDRIGYLDERDPLEISTYNDIPPENDLKLTDENNSGNELSAGYYGFGNPSTLINFSGSPALTNQNFITSNHYSSFMCVNTNNLSSYATSCSDLMSLHSRPGMSHSQRNGSVGSPLSSSTSTSSGPSGRHGHHHNLKQGIYGGSSEIRDCVDLHPEVGSGLSSDELCVESAEDKMDKTNEDALVPTLLMQDSPMTSQHVKSLSSLCPPFPEARLTSLSPAEDTDCKSKGEFCQGVQLYFVILIYHGILPPSRRGSYVE